MLDILAPRYGNATIRIRGLQEAVVIGPQVVSDLDGYDARKVKRFSKTQSMGQ